MKTFLQWAKDKNYELPLMEKTIRTGIHTAMPTGYIQHQYPDAYFMPTSGTAALDLQNLRNKVKDKAPPNNAP